MTKRWQEKGGEDWFLIDNYNPKKQVKIKRILGEGGKEGSREGWMEGGGKEGKEKGEREEEKEI